MLVPCVMLTSIVAEMVMKHFTTTAITAFRLTDLQCESKKIPPPEVF